MSDLVTERFLLDMLKRMRYKFSTDKELAEHLGVSSSYLADVLMERRAIAEKIAKALGYKPVRMYTTDVSNNKESAK